MKPPFTGERPDRIQRVRVLLDLATEALCRAGTGFDLWARWMTEEAQQQQDQEPTARELIWAWQTLRADRELNAAFGFLESPPDWVRAAAKQEDAKSFVVVCAAGTIFKIRLRTEMDRPDLAKDYRNGKRPRPMAFVRLEEPLCLRPIRGGRLGCSATTCTLITPVFESADRAILAMLFGVQPGDVSFRGDQGEAVHVRCRSLNHAYTLASQRFERARKSRGGRIYENFEVYIPRANVSLESVRMAAERGKCVLDVHEIIDPIDVPWRAG